MASTVPTTPMTVKLKVASLLSLFESFRGVLKSLTSESQKTLAGLAGKIYETEEANTNEVSVGARRVEEECSLATKTEGAAWPRLRRIYKRKLSCTAARARGTFGGGSRNAARCWRIAPYAARRARRYSAGGIATDSPGRELIRRTPERARLRIDVLSVGR